MTISQAQAAKRLLGLKKSQNSFTEFVKMMNPDLHFANFTLQEY